MSQEITVTSSLAFNKGGVTDSLSSGNVKVDMVGTKYIKRMQSIPTTAGGTALDVAGLATLGCYALKNLDPANAVDLMDAVSGNVINTAKGGEFIQGRLPSGASAPAALAHTASVNVIFLIVEN